MLDNATVKDWARIVSVSMAGMLVSLLAGQLILNRMHDLRLQDYAADVLDHAVDVATATRRNLARAQSIDAAVCSDGDIAELRALLIRSRFVRDIGRTRDGQVTCTAMRGELAEPIALPPPQHLLADGTVMWTDIDDIFDTRAKVDIFSADGVIVFSPTVAFNQFKEPDPGFGALVLSHDGGYAFKTFGDVTELRAQLHRKLAWYHIGTLRRTTECSAEFDLCVVAQHSSPSLLQEPLALLLALAAGLLTGGSLGWAWMLRRRDLSTSVERQLRHAIEAKTITVAYQPLIHIRDGRRVGVEALARLNNTQGIPIPPDVFIPAAEQMRLIGQVTRIVVNTALTEMRSRLIENEDFHVSINLSVSDVVDPTLLEFLNKTTARLGIPHHQVALEITERSTEEHQLLTDSVDQLRNHGYRLYIDDFGTGYSSLAYLSKLTVDAIKVDKMFTQAIGKDAVSSTIIGQICATVQALGLGLVVEGIETEEQAFYVVNLQPDVIGQGWLYGKPVRASELMH